MEGQWKSGGNFKGSSCKNPVLTKEIATVTVLSERAVWVQERRNAFGVPWGEVGRRRGEEDRK